MASPTSVLSRTLQSISLSKIRELDSRRNSYEARKRDFLDKAHAASDPRDRLSFLLNGYRALSPKASTDHSLDNIERWLAQSKYDASIPESRLATFDHQLHAKLDVESRRLDMAHLYSRLLTEWMEQPCNNTGPSQVAESQRQRLNELVKKFESVVFEPLETSEVEIRKFLDRLFPDETSRKHLESLRGRVSRETSSLRSETTPFNRESLTSCIKGLLAEDLLSDEKRAILKDFLESDVAKDEIADVLNMRFADLARWQWNAGDDGIPVMPRAGLNGKYRIWADDDILQMLFVQYIGVRLSTMLKSALKQFMEQVYTRDIDGHRPLSKRDLDRRRYYLDEGQDFMYEEGVEETRKDNFLETFFLSQLPSSETSLFDGAQQYDNDSDADSEDIPHDQPPKKRTNIRQEVLRQLTADTLIYRLRGVDHKSPEGASGPVAVVQTDIQWFGTSIPHSTAFAVMRYVGFQEEWIEFFQKYLEAPLNLDAASGDRPQTGPRARKRGVPMAHASEKLIGELLMFCMDVAVNRETGILLYRLHDDIWFCGEPDATARAWSCMKEYSSIFGFEFNNSKTGSVYLPGTFGSGRDPLITQALPAGSVTVGFLCLDPEFGKWVIDQERVKAHVDQLDKQLKDCKSVLSWVQTWNSCIGRFFSHTFGEPALCLGVEHVDAVLDTYSRMVKRLIPTGSVIEHVKSMVQSHFDLLASKANLPDAFIYLPEQLGGLSLRNPFVPLLLVRKDLTKSPGVMLSSFLQDEYDHYRRHKATFEATPKWQLRSRLQSICPDEPDSDEEDDNNSQPPPVETTKKSTNTPPIAAHEANTFMSLEEFASFREYTSRNLTTVYENRLLSVPDINGITIDKRTLDALNDSLSDESSATDSTSWHHQPTYRGGRGSRGGRGGFGRTQASFREPTSPKKISLTPEHKWFIALYADELIETYGGLSLVDKQFLPGGVLSMMREKKVTWQMVL